MTWNEIEKENEARRRVVNRKMAELRSTFDVEYFHGSFHGPRHAEANAAWIAFLAELENRRLCGACGELAPAGQSCLCFDNGCE